MKFRPPLRARAMSSSATPPVEPPAKRRVSFSLIPKGAQLTLDGQDRGSPFGQVFALEPGPHAIRATVPSGSTCCKPKHTTVTVTAPPDGDPDAIQTIVVQLDRRPSTVTLVGGPTGARFACPSIGLAGSSGVPVTVTLPVVSWTGFCEFSPGGAKGTVVLSAGQSNSVPWPGG
ncbi:MAG: hypothetical protein JRI23_05710 [Deltaproteobacteria bacterium]|jgi:hypothetical protein|nr:hypothetical protein [Deltaproteobacteria bacterium]MBW2531058.1 hypothetical protein [Deltaproteobacteria bacterium]